MSRFFTPDNPVMEFIAKIFDLVILNLIFIFSCVPIITIGASTSALSYVTLKMVRGEDPYIWRNFWKSFRQNFKQGTLVWIFSILIFIFLGMDFYIINSQNTSLFAVVRILLWIVCAVALSVFLYVFPVISHFVCTTKQALKNALLMTFGHLPYTLMMLALAGLLLFLCSSSSKLFAMIVVLSGICGFSVVSFVYSIMFDRIFQKYESET
ncbi:MULTISPECIES: YesL family protein [Dorea]|uniref:YesL family protein n=1 Tax=Dorea TaxID=189330 RepID=UPI000E53D626|nr:MULTISPECIES: YesL family protein [Dorea]RGU09241.1 DUF624 domain-containing protein [Dorea longicatena]